MAAILLAAWSGIARASDGAATADGVPKAAETESPAPVAESPVQGAPAGAVVEGEAATPARTTDDAAAASALAPAATATTTETESEPPALDRAALEAETAPAAETATARATSPPAPAARATPDDPAPQESEPDPLTPPAADTGPLAAPGAPARPAAVAATAPAAVHPVVEAVRSALAARQARDAIEKLHLEALGAHYGEPDARPIWVTEAGLTPAADAAIATFARAATFGLDPDAFVVPARPLPGADAASRAEVEIKLGLAALLYARHARGGRLDPPSVSQLFDMRPRLYQPRSLLSALDVAASVDAYLEGLHPKHAGFVGLRKALASVRTEAEGEGAKDGESRKGSTRDTDAVRRIVSNMERWRWLPDDLGPFYVWDNVPEQYTSVFRDGKEVLRERMVVGKPGTPTPVFSAPMKYVIFHPSWGVPNGIKTNELGPMLRRAQSNSSGWFFSSNDGASRALLRHELRVMRGGREINPDSVNWSAVDIRQFHFMQPPSSRNVLGIVKFRFPNRFDVYMHDTSERHLFQRSSRTFSHGCLRVENPLRLAEAILSYDQGWDRARVDAAVRRGGTTNVTLEKQVPVHIVYFTATADTAGKLAVYPDIYGLDSRVASALAGRSVTLASAKATADQAAASGSTPPRRQAVQRRNQPSPASPPSRPFNPFANISGN